MRWWTHIIYLPLRITLAVATLAVMAVAGAVIAIISFFAVLFGNHFTKG